MPWIPPQPDPEVAGDKRRALWDLLTVVVLIAIAVAVLVVLVIVNQ